MTSRTMLAAGLALAVLAAGCGSEESDGAAVSGRLPQGGEHVKLNPADFTTRIDNPYWPMTPGTKWVYRETDVDGSAQRVVVTVTNRTKKVASGIVARVIHDRVTEKGKLVEDTYDWYAQDNDGNIWYFGEAVKNYENGKFKGTHGSWEAGVRGAEAGVIMPTAPKVGMTYRQEYYKAHAEDAADVLSLDQKAQVKYGFFRGTLLTRDYSPIEPRAVELKFYAKGVGQVLALTVSGGAEREELLSYVKGRR
jgi:hypothetical protein